MIADGINYEEINKTRQERLLKENAIRWYFLEQFKGIHEQMKGSSVSDETIVLRFFEYLASLKEQKVGTENGEMVFKYNRIVYLSGEEYDWDTEGGDIIGMDSLIIPDVYSDYPRPGILIEALTEGEKLNVELDQEIGYYNSPNTIEMPSDEFAKVLVFRNTFLEGMRQIYESRENKGEGNLVFKVDEYPAKLEFVDIN